MDPAKEIKDYQPYVEGGTKEAPDKEMEVTVGKLQLKFTEKSKVE